MRLSERALLVALLGAFIRSAVSQAVGVQSWCNAPSTFTGGDPHKMFKQPCNADSTTGTLTACEVSFIAHLNRGSWRIPDANLSPTQTMDNWFQQQSVCMIPGSISSTSNANFPMNNVCGGAVTTWPLTDSVNFIQVGTIYVFKDYQDNLYVTAALDGANYPNQYPGQPIVTIPNVFTGTIGAKLFAWPVLNLTAYANYTNYNDQLTSGR